MNASLGFGAPLDSYDRCDCAGLQEHAEKIAAGTHAPIENLSGITPGGASSQPEPSTASASHPDAIAPSAPEREQ